MNKYIAVIFPIILAACAEPPPPAIDRPMDEVPVQQTLANGDRQYGFASGCVIVIEPDRAVVKSEDEICELHHRDIALLYAAGD